MAENINKMGVVEILNGIMECGVSEKVAKEVFSMQKYSNPDFARFVYKSILKVRPVLADAWFKASLRYLMINFNGKNSIEARDRKQVVNKKRSVVAKGIVQDKKDLDFVDMAKQIFDKLPEKKIDILIDRVKGFPAGMPRMVLKNQAFVLFCDSFCLECYGTLDDCEACNGFGHEFKNDIV